MESTKLMKWNGARQRGGAHNPQIDEEERKKTNPIQQMPQLLC